jgi:hypothetical protein
MTSCHNRSSYSSKFVGVFCFFLCLVVCESFFSFNTRCRDGQETGHFKFRHSKILSSQIQNNDVDKRLDSFRDVGSDHDVLQFLSSELIDRNTTISRSLPFDQHDSTPFNNLTYQRPNNKQLILLSGSTGTGKSTLGMSIALHHHILKCISTDTIRQVLRSVYAKATSSTDGNRDGMNPALPIENTRLSFDSYLVALHRSSYALKPTDSTLFSLPDDPIENWMECCSVLQNSIANLISDAMKRHESLILEGVHIIPSNSILDEWKRSGGSALGILLVISDPKVHEEVLFQRGKLKQSSEKAKDQLQSFLRIRQIQEKMIQLAQENNWLIMEQRIH